MLGDQYLANQVRGRTSLGEEWSWDSGRGDKAAYGEQVVGPWQTVTNKWFMRFGFVLLDAGKALFFFFFVARGGISPTGSVKAVSRRW